MSEEIKVRVEKQFTWESVLLTELAEACDEMENLGVTPTHIEIQDSCEDSRYITLVGFRPEMTVETEARLEDEKRIREARTDHERREFERLKKKFESGK